MEDRMDYQSDEERLVAEQAALHYRELKQVMKTAPHGKGMAVMEQAVRRKRIRADATDPEPADQRP